MALREILLLCATEFLVSGLRYFINWQLSILDFYVAPIMDYPATVNPCVPSPCGLNAICQVFNEVPSCSCVSGYFGSPPNCRPECTVNSECPSNKACIREKCQDPCPGSCGQSASCTVTNHIPICTCFSGYIGDPFTHCEPAPRNLHTIFKQFLK